MNKKTISMIIPCYNEEKSLKLFFEETNTVVKEVKNYEFEYVFINDGSTDNTLDELFKLKNNNSNIKIINLSRNFGKECALTAGLEYTKSDAAIPIDADLQHPPAIILDFIKYWEKGYDVVLAKRTDREKNLKSPFTSIFYNLHNKISNVKIPKDVGDFRLISRKVIDAIKKLPENQRFMKGIFAFVGFKEKTIEFEPKNRLNGSTSFNKWKLWNLALDGITSFSTVPLRIWLYIGSIIAFLSFIYGSLIIIKTLLFGVDIAGYASLVTIILFLGGIQLMGIGILGEYIGRIYFEAKNRPSYIVENIYE